MNNAIIDHWHSFFNKFAQLINNPCPEGNSDCSLRGPADLEPSCRDGEAMEHLYCRIQAKLRDNQTESNGCALAVWNKFARSLGINEVALQEKWRRERLCGNPRCERSKEKDPKEKRSIKSAFSANRCFTVARHASAGMLEFYKSSCYVPSTNTTIVVIRTEGHEAETLKRIIEHLHRSPC